MLYVETINAYVESIYQRKRPVVSFPINPLQYACMKFTQPLHESFWKPRKRVHTPRKRPQLTTVLSLHENVSKRRCFRENFLKGLVVPCSARLNGKHHCLKVSTHVSFHQDFFKNLGFGFGLVSMHATSIRTKRERLTTILSKNTNGSKDANVHGILQGCSCRPDNKGVRRRNTHKTLEFVLIE